MKNAPHDFRTATPAGHRPHVVILNDSSIARGGATGLALMSARMLRERGHEVTFISGDAGDDGALAAQGITLVPMGGKLLLDAKRGRAIRDGIYNARIRDRIAREIAAHDRPDTIYHLHGWSRILSPAVFDALKPVAGRTFIHAHDYFLACPNGIYFDYRRGESCTRTPLSAGCLATNCDRRAYGHKLWRVLRHQALRRAFGGGVPWAGVLTLGPGMTPGLQRAGLSSEHLRPVVNPARPFTDHRLKAEEGKRLAYIGRTEIGKGVKTLCRAARGAGVPLRIIGDVSGRPDLPREFPEVEFTGWVDHADIGKHLHDVRALVVPSRYPEPFGLVSAEASLSGLPILISDVMLLADDIVDKALGWSVTTRDETALADALKRVAALPHEEIRAISERGFAGEDRISLSPEGWIDTLQMHYAAALARA